MRFSLLSAALLSAALLAGGCAGLPSPSLDRITGESMVFVGAEPSALAFAPSPAEKLVLRSTYRPGPGTIEYEEGRDFRVDLARGTLVRLPGSRLPDFTSNVLHGQKDFDHTRFPGYGNKPFFAYADYRLAARAPWPVQPPQAHLLLRARAKLAAGGPMTVVAFGDSITHGGEASAPELVFWQRWVHDLSAKYPAARINALNGATGGDTSTRGLQRLQAKVLDTHPDLVLVAFGMNDHNRRGVPVPDFERQLREMVGRIRDSTTADIVLCSTFPPNPLWTHGSHRMEEYAAATQRVAAETNCAYADVFHNWQAIAARKRPEDLLANNINHPNDFGHWIYYRVLAALDL